MLKHRVFLLRNWEKMREKQELLKREGDRERERENSGPSLYTRWGGVIRDDGNIKSGVWTCKQFINLISSLSLFCFESSGKCCTISIVCCFFQMYFWLSSQRCRRHALCAHADLRQPRRTQKLHALHAWHTSSRRYVTWSQATRVNRH